MTRPENEAEAYRLIDEFADKLRGLALDKPIPKAWRKHLRNALPEAEKQPSGNPRDKERDVEIMAAYLLAKAENNPAILGAAAEALNKAPDEEPASRDTISCLAKRFNVNRRTIERTIDHVRSDPIAMLSASSKAIILQAIQTDPTD